MIESLREFAKPEYGVDLLKLESPLAANDLPRPDGSSDTELFGNLDANRNENELQVSP